MCCLSYYYFYFIFFIFFIIVVTCLERNNCMFFKNTKKKTTKEWNNTKGWHTRGSKLVIFIHHIEFPDNWVRHNRAHASGIMNCKFFYYYFCTGVNLFTKKHSNICWIEKIIYILFYYYFCFSIFFIYLISCSFWNCLNFKWTFFCSSFAGNLWINLGNLHSRKKSEREKKEREHK